MRKFVIKAVVAASMVAASLAAQAGPYILAGTDADDHGSASTTANLDGWLFMQRAIENLAGAVTNGNKVVTILGSISSAASAANSAFGFSSLGAAGWTINTVSTSSFATFFGAGGALSSTGILLMDSGNSNISGGVDGSAFVPYASSINNFLGAGGGLFSQANGYQWLNALLPQLSVVGSQNTGLTLTSAGSAAFPGLTNADLSAGPWHEYFTNVGSIPVLATGLAGGVSRAVIIGAAAGSITDPVSNVPEPGALALLGIGAAALALARRRTRG